MNTATASTRTRAALDDPQVLPGHPDSGLDSPVIRTALASRLVKVTELRRAIRAL